MDTMTYSAARADLAKTIDNVCLNREPVVIRKRGEAVVMMCLDDYEAWAETFYLLRSPENAKRLQSSITALERGDAVSKSMRELLDAQP